MGAVVEVPPVPEFEPAPKTPSLSIKQEMHNSAKELMDNPAFKKAILDLRKRWYSSLMTSEGESAAAMWRGKLQALEAIPTELKAIMNEFKHV